MKSPESAKVELASLVSIFFDDAKMLGQFSQVDAEQIPEPQRSLLNHNVHMTVTVEKFHSSDVDVKVLETHSKSNVYSREILLTRQSDDFVVQYGIVRIHLEHLNDTVRQEVECRESPLGRILIKHDVMRFVELHSLFEIEAGEALASALNQELGHVCYGRTALIYCNSEPAIELLEIVTV